MQGKKNNGKQIFILIICVIAFVITFIIQGKNGRDGNTSLNGVIAQIQVIISTVMVVASMKKGFITGIISNACLSGFVLFQVIKKFIDSNQAKIDSDEAKSLALLGEAPLSERWISRLNFLSRLSVASTSRHNDLAPNKCSRSYCVSSEVMTRSFIPVMIRRTSCASGILFLNSSRIRSSSIGRILCKRSKSFCCCSSGVKSVFMLIIDSYLLL